MPTKMVANVETGEVAEVELTAEELARAEDDRLEAEAAAAYAASVRPDYGDDATPREQIKDGVTQLRAYLALPSPTVAQTVGALKLTIRGLLFLLRRALA